MLAITDHTEKDIYRYIIYRYIGRQIFSYIYVCVCVYTHTNLYVYMYVCVYKLE